MDSWTTRRKSIDDTRQTSRIRSLTPAAQRRPPTSATSGGIRRVGQAGAPSLANCPFVCQSTSVASTWAAFGSRFPHGWPLVGGNAPSIAAFSLIHPPRDSRSEKRSGQAQTTITTAMTKNYNPLLLLNGSYSILNRIPQALPTAIIVKHGSSDVVTLQEPISY